MKPILPVLLLLLTLTEICAQGYTPIYGRGYVVTINNDTIEGTFLRDDSRDSFYKVYFENEWGARKYYEPGSLLCYKKGNYLFFPRRFEYRRGFLRKRKIVWGYLQLKIDGEVKLFVFGGPDSVWGAYTRTYYYVERKNRTTRVKEDWNGNRRQMKEYFSDDPIVIQKIKSRVYNYSMMPSLVKEYNSNKLIKQ